MLLTQSPLTNAQLGKFGGPPSPPPAPHPALPPEPVHEKPDDHEVNAEWGVGDHEPGKEAPEPEPRGVGVPKEFNPFGAPEKPEPKPAWEPAPKPEPSPWSPAPHHEPAPAPEPSPFEPKTTPAAPAGRPPPTPPPERPERGSGDVDLMDDEEMDDPDWYRDNEARVPCFKFAETGLYNLSGLKNFNGDWSTTSASGNEVSFNFCYYVNKAGCKPDDPESFALEKQGVGTCL